MEKQKISENKFEITEEIKEKVINLKSKYQNKLNLFIKEKEFDKKLKSLLEVLKSIQEELEKKNEGLIDTKEIENIMEIYLMIILNNKLKKFHNKLTTNFENDKTELKNIIRKVFQRLFRKFMIDFEKYSNIKMENFEYNEITYFYNIIENTFIMKEYEIYRNFLEFEMFKKVNEIITNFIKKITFSNIINTTNVENLILLIKLNNDIFHKYNQFFRLILIENQFEKNFNSYEKNNEFDNNLIEGIKEKDFFKNIYNDIFKCLIFLLKNENFSKFNKQTSLLLFQLFSIHNDDGFFFFFF
jgi:hypothetical protein